MPSDFVEFRMLAQGRVRPKMQAVKFHEETVELIVGALFFV